MRSRKSVNGAVTDYYYGPDGLLQENRPTCVIRYLYDLSGISGFEMTSLGTKTSYHYVKSPQGDVVAILDASGVALVRYQYDAWGNTKIFALNNGNSIDITNNMSYTNHIGRINPIRYRGYYHDEETGLFYLQSRYYDSEVGRFISPDSFDYLSPESINGLNCYAYCGNTPVMFTDSTGHYPNSDSQGLIYLLFL